MLEALTITFPGTEVDQWLDGIVFAATLANGKIKVSPTPETKREFEKMDTEMWLSWAQKHANTKFASTLKRKQQV